MKDKIKLIKDAVDKHQQKMFDVLNYMWNNPETGFREWKANDRMIAEFEALGYNLTKAENVPGFYTVIDTGKPGPTVLVLGELDALLCPTHFHADSETGAAHACGHNAQSAALLGVAAALQEPNILDGLCGKIKLCAVPAEEVGEMEFRKELKNKGVISQYSGKREFICRGYFDDCDMAFLVHHLPVDYYSAEGKAVGFVAKRAVFKGVAAHAGAEPHNGANALYAATSGLASINAIRETFREEDYIRVHPIITEGGSAVNTIPDRVCVESYVRGLTFEGLQNANNRVNRALCGSAVTMGCELEIEDVLAASPMIESKELGYVAEEAIKSFIPDAEWHYFDRVDTGSTDMGDVSCLMPVVHLYCPGVTGKGHGVDYAVSDPDIACGMSAKWQIMMLDILLGDNAKRANDVIKNFVPRFASKEEYLAMQDKFVNNGDCVFYNDDNSVVIKY